MPREEKKLEEVVLTRLLNLNAILWGLVTGIIAGLAIFIATNWLILKGGHMEPGGEIVVGPHLVLLGQFFPGYRVTFVGSLIGFTYGFLSGFGIGYVVARIYNWLADLRDGKRQNSL